MNIYGIDTSFLVAAEITAHPDHPAARQTLRRLLTSGDGNQLALVPQVLAEFIHVATDPRRFERPLDSVAAIERARSWWLARETRPLFPNAAATVRFLDWMRDHHLGRKRLLDTLLASTWREAGVSRLLTLNPADFAIFGGFETVAWRT